jgi:putative oxidoreductase
MRLQQIATTWTRKMNVRELLSGGNRHALTTDIGLLVLRLYTGLALALAHGIGKVPPSDGFINRVGQMGMPAPELFAWLAGLAELAGGLLLALGLLTRPVSAVIVIHFVIVAFVAHAGDPFGARELALFFLVAALLFMLAGPGRLSIDRFFWTKHRTRNF